jgi:hypothetical protein
MEQLKYFNERSSRLQYRNVSRLNSYDSVFLQSLLTRPSIVTSHRKEKHRKKKIIKFSEIINSLSDSDIPITDAVLNLVHTCLHSRDAIISNESIHRILRTIFGHLIEEFVD